MHLSNIEALFVWAAAYPSQAEASVLLPRNAVPPPFQALPSYPSPYGGWTPEWGASYDKAQALVSRMTLAEKANITSGTGLLMDRCIGNTGSAPRLGFPQLCLQDSALGVRDTDNVTAFPAGITTGATWDKALMLARGVAIGQEFRGKGVSVYLGPTVGPLGRKPRGGRNWEGFGADPVLQGVGGSLTIQGVQQQGVMATIKHFIGNEQEMYRMYNTLQPGISSNIDDRALHELYMWPFAEGVRAGVTAVMASYNAVNGSASSQNSYMLNHLLKEELGFQGFIMSDWLAQISGVSSALAGLDMAMPGDTMIPLFGNSYWMYEMSRSILNGSMPVDRLDDMATRIVAAWYQVSQDIDFPEPNFSSWTTDPTGKLHPGTLAGPDVLVNEYVNVQANHATVAKQISQDAITMLKNDRNVLPLTRDTPLFVFGTDAQVNPEGPNACADRTCDTGTLGMGWGSGTDNYPYFDDPLTAMEKASSNVTAYYSDSFPSDVPTPLADDVAVVFLSSDSGENQNTVEGNHGDRDASGLAAWHNGDKLVQDVAAKYQNVVVVIHTVGPLVLESWINLPTVAAVVIAHLPGQEAGESLTNVLYGSVSPSGHLPYTIPKSESDYPASVSLVGFEVGQPQDTFSEGLYIDYRHFNKEGITPRYAFGHGLSYTNFTFTNATISKITQLSTTPPAPSDKPASLLTAYNTTIPAASEAIQPTGFSTYYRYLYPWLSSSDATKAATTGAAVASGKSTGYPYPAGYSTNQTLTPPPSGGGSGGNPALWDIAYTVSLTVTNIGTQYAGKAVAQLYVQFPDDDGGFDTPIVQLRDFEKTATLEPGESALVELVLTRKDVSVWDVVRQNWVVPVVDGNYRFWIGQASDRLYLACFGDTLGCEEGLVSPV